VSAGHLGDECGVDDGTGIERFVIAQDDGGTYDDALRELRVGRKRTHWMWFVFPQVAGLGRSATAQRFALVDLGEARAYLAHPVLGPRLRACASALLDQPEPDPDVVLGEVDAAKLRSSMTLFAAAAPDDPLFPAVLDRFFGGVRDDATLQRL
jgi:uncharacterized protein (DUF1810 family)